MIAGTLAAEANAVQVALSRVGNIQRRDYSPLYIALHPNPVAESCKSELFRTKLRLS